MISWQELAKQQQAVIDQATDAIVTTKKTQTKLEQQLDYADYAVSTHNVDGEAHPDIREQMSRFFDDPTISGPDAVEYGEENTWQFNATARTNIAKLEKFYVDHMDGTREIVPANSDGPTSWSHVFTGERNTYIWFSVMAYGSSFFSDKVTQKLWLTHHLPPDMSKMTCTLPDVVNHGETHTFRYAGVTDEDGDLARVDAESSSDHIKLNLGADLQPDTDYTITVNDDLTEPEDVSITFTATDQLGLKTTRVYVVHINGLPKVNNLTHTLPNRITANTTYKARISGITDPDGEPSEITYSIESNIPAITFSKSTGINQNEDITVICGEVAAGTPYTLTVTAKDRHGGTAQTTIDSTINTLPNLSGLTTNLHAYMYPGESQSIYLTGGVDSDDHEVTYSLETDYPGVLQFSKAVGIKDNEKFTFTASSAAIRGNTYTYRVIGTDVSQASVSVTRNVKINRKITASQIVLDADKFVKCTEPSTEYIVTLNPATDADGHTLNYRVTSSDEHCTVESMSANQISLTSPSEDTVARGGSYKLRVVADDGYETVGTDVTINQNRVPDVSNFKLVTVKYLTAGIANKATVTGVTDPDNTKVTFTVQSSLNSITFPENNGQLVPDLPFEIIVDPEAVPGQTFTLTFTFKDEDGGINTATYDGQINAAPEVTNLVIDGLPQYVIPGNTYPIRLHGAVDPNGEGITYTMQNPVTGVSFSKTSGIAENEEISLIIAPDVTRGDTLFFTVAAVDPSNASTGKTFQFKVNQVLNGTTALSWAPKFRHPGTTTWADSAVLVDQDGHALAYTITANTPLVTFCTTDATTGQTTEDLTSLEAFTPSATKKFGIKLDPSLPRGTVVVLNASVTDGYETWRSETNLYVKKFPINFRTDRDINQKGGNEFSQDYIISWDDEDISLGYTSTLTSWTGFAQEYYSIGNAGTVYTSGNTVHIKLAKVATETPRVFNISLAISDGITVVNNNYELNTTAQPIIVTAPPSITYPINGQEVPYEGFTITWTEIATMVDMDQDHVYPSDGN